MFDRNGLILMVEHIVSWFKDYYTEQLKTLKEKLEAIIREKEDEYKGAKGKLKAIAQEAKDVREKQIMPLRKEVENFINYAK